MINNIIPFHYQSRTVRVVIVNGEPKFVAKDVCEALEISNYSQAVNGQERTRPDGSKYWSGGLDDDEKGLHNVYTPGGEQQLLCVSEAGLYKLIMQSHKPEAKPFQRFVTHDVLPSIRKTGKYETPKAVDTSKEEMLAIRRMNAESKLISERRKQGEALQTMIKEFAPDISPISKQSLIAKTVELIAGEPVIPLPKVEQHFLSCEDIGKRIGLYSLSGKPHKQAVAALLQHLDIEEVEKITVVESNGAWQGTTVKYAESVLSKIENYLLRMGKPDALVLDRAYQVKWASQ